MNVCLRILRHINDSNISRGFIFVVSRIFLIFLKMNPGLLQPLEMLEIRAGCDERSIN